MQLIVMDEKTTVTPYGWVFYCNSTQFLETRLHKHRLVGNGPIRVNKFERSVTFVGSSPKSLAKHQEYEAQWNRDHGGSAVSDSAVEPPTVL